MVKRKGKNQKLAQDVAAVNRFGCGCIVVILFGIVLAMILAGLLRR